MVINSTSKNADISKTYITPDSNYELDRALHFEFGDLSDPIFHSELFVVDLAALEHFYFEISRRLISCLFSAYIEFSIILECEYSFAPLYQALI